MWLLAGFAVGAVLGFAGASLAVILVAGVVFGILVAGGLTLAGR
jgi:hypothetical protein